MSVEEIEKLSNDKVQEFIFAHANDDENKLLLKHKAILGLPTSLVVQQISARKKGQTKLPLFFSTEGIVYPPTLNLEQSSSEATAKFKAKIISDEFANQKLKIADLTGGFGVDSYFLSKIASELIYVESNAGLLTIATHNHSTLGANNIKHQISTAENFLNEEKKFDLIFIDPSRRNSKNKKLFLLSDCEPDVLSLLPQLLVNSPHVLIKTSPLLDIQKGLKELGCVKKIIVVSVGNDCKELLFLLKKDFGDSASIETYNLENNGAIKHYFQFSLKDEQECVSDFDNPKQFLYEPNSSILKAGAFKFIGKKFNLKKLAVNTHLYTSIDLNLDFPGRIFEIISEKFDAKLLSEKKANIISRNHPLTPSELKQKFKLADGGENYLIAFSGVNKKYIVLAKRLA